MTVLLPLLWLLLGAGAGWLVRKADVRLAATEELTPGGARWQILGPPVLCALLFAIFAARIGTDWKTLLIDSLWVTVLVQVIFFDLEHRLILDLVLAPSALAALFLSAVAAPPSWQMSLLGGLAGGGFFVLVMLVGALITGQEAMGFGDVKLVAFMGLMLGLFRGRQDHFTSPLLTALLTGVLLGGVVSLLVVLLRLRKIRDSIAYGPFLAAGALIVLFELGPQ